MFNSPLTNIINRLTTKKSNTSDHCSTKLQLMKKIFLLLVVALGAGTLSAQQAVAVAKKSEAVAIFKWDETSFDFGKILKGKPATHQFEFVNNGTVPLIITGVKPSCGCTTPEWTKEPIPAGGTGFIKATYNAAALGAFSKTITITSNADGNPIVLIIKGEVKDTEVIE